MVQTSTSYIRSPTKVKNEKDFSSLWEISLEFRIIVLLGQCNSQLEYAQQAARFNQQWESLLHTAQKAFETYQNQLMVIRQEQNSLVHLDTIQVIFAILPLIYFYFPRIFNNFDCNANRI